MKKVLIIGLLILGAACAPVEADDARDWPNGWTDGEVTKLHTMMDKETSLTEDEQVCMAAEIVSEFSPYEVRDELSERVSERIEEITEMCT